MANTMTTVPRRSRPPRPHELKVKLGADELAAIRAQAEAAHRPLAEFVRLVALGQIDRTA